MYDQVMLLLTLTLSSKNSIKKINQKEIKIKYEKTKSTSCNLDTCVSYKYTMCTLWGEHAIDIHLDVILLVLSIIF